jgi:hypothetical protein
MKIAAKPIVKEAIQYTGKNARECIDFAQASGRHIILGENDFLEIDTLEGYMYADKKDWIIRGVKGEIYPCKPDIFEETYTVLKAGGEK